MVLSGAPDPIWKNKRKVPLQPAVNKFNGEQNGKRSKTSTETDNQHGMTSGTPATAGREVSQPSHTHSKISVLSEPMRTAQSKQLDNPLRSKSNCNMKQLKQSKQLSSPERSSNSSFNPDTRYYKPSTDTKTYFVNSQGHLQSRGEPVEFIKTNDKGKLPDSKEAPIYHEPGLIVINNTEEPSSSLPQFF